jgi:hypothetical protein
VGMKLPMAHEGLEIGMQVLDTLRASFIHLLQVY